MEGPLLSSAGGNGALVRVEGLIVCMGGRIVLQVSSLEVQRGEIFAVIGPNGAGKSTLLLTLALLVRPNAGTIHFGGEEAVWSGNALQLRRRMAVVFQEPLLLDTTVGENVATGLRLRGRRTREVEQQVAKWLVRFGIEHLAHRQARSLSGGEAQRTSLARAFALEPELLLLDEPFANLDEPTRLSIIENLKTVLAETGITTVLVTHDRNEALALGDRVGVLIDGQLRQCGSAEEVFGSPVDEEVASFVGVETVVPTVVTHQQDGLARLSLAGQTVQVASQMPVGSQVLLCLRPEHVTLMPLSDEHHASSARNRLAGTVQRVDPWGTQVRVLLHCGFPLVSLITQQSAIDLGVRVGARMVASFKANSAHLIRR